VPIMTTFSTGVDMSLKRGKALSRENKLTTKGEISGGDKGDFCPGLFAHIR